MFNLKFLTYDLLRYKLSYSAGDWIVSYSSNEHFASSLKAIRGFNYVTSICVCIAYICVFRTSIQRRLRGTMRRSWSGWDRCDGSVACLWWIASFASFPSFHPSQPYRCQYQRRLDGLIILAEDDELLRACHPFLSFRRHRHQQCSLMWYDVFLDVSILALQ